MQAGYYVLYAYGYIPPMVEDFHIETACSYTNDYEIFPVAYRTHSHNLGKNWPANNLSSTKQSS